MVKDQKEKQFRIMLLNNMKKDEEENGGLVFTSYYVKYGNKTYSGYSPDDVIYQINKHKLRSSNDLKGTKKERA